MHPVTRAALTAASWPARGTARTARAINRWRTDQSNLAHYNNALAAKAGDYQDLRAERDLLIRRRTTILLVAALAFTVFVAWQTILDAVIAIPPLAVIPPDWAPFIPAVEYPGAEWRHPAPTWAWAIPVAIAAAVTAIGIPAPHTDANDQPAPTAAGDKHPWGGNLAPLQQALTDAGLLKPDQTIRAIEKPHKVGRGIAGTAQLPSGLSVAQCIARKERIGSGLGADSKYLQLAKGANDGQLKFWVPIDDPFENNTRQLPLISEPSWNSWKPAPFAFTADDKTVMQRLMYSNMLIGSKPGAGKTFAARCAIAPYILDPTVKIYIANGKFDGAWAAVKPFAQRYIRGRADEQALALDDMLTEVQTEMDRRFLEHMDDASKVVEGMGLAPILVVVDELQNYTTNSTPAEKPLRGKKATIGQWIDHRLVDIVKNGRAAGVILIIITQRPSEESLSTELRAQVGTRLALKTMDFHTSNMILGQVSKRGIDASELDAQYKGVGIYVPDMEEDLLDESLGAYPTVRTFLCSDEDWAAMCERGRALRRDAGTLPQIEPAEPARQVEQPESVLQLVPEPEPEIVRLVRSVWPEGRDRASCAELAAALGWAAGAEVTRRLDAEADISVRSVRIGTSTPKGLYWADLAGEISETA